jgi:hypothetical protein
LSRFELPRLTLTAFFIGPPGVGRFYEIVL